MRLSSPSMAAAVIEGVADAGADVVDIGLVGTEMVYFAVDDRDLDGGICVTASHNPKDYTGMKIVRRGALPVGGDSGLAEIRDRALGELGPVERRGDVRDDDVWPGFVEKVLSFVDPSALRPLRVVVDAANGMAGVMLPPVLERLPQLEVVGATSSPTARSRTTSRIPSCPRTASSSSGRRGRRRRSSVSPSTATAIAASSWTTRASSSPATSSRRCSHSRCSQKEPGSKVIYDVRASWAVRRAIEEAGGTALVNRVGHAFIKHRMRKEDAAFAGEVSAHYYFRDFSRADSGVVPFLLMLELLSRTDEKLSEILAPFRERYFLTGEINTPVADVPLKLQELKERYAGEGGRISHLDGLSVEFDDWHFNVRPSNTEPLLRLNLEALAEQLMEAKRDEVLALIRA